MKKILFLSLFSIVLLSCSEDNDVNIEPASITLNFSHTWQDTEVTNADFNEIKFTNANGEQLSIERLRYVISEITLTHESGVVTTINEHNLVDVTNAENLSFVTSAGVLPGKYSSVVFRFGLSNDYNIEAAYQDLNTANFSVPEAQGGGYHFIQLDGKYLDSNNAEAPFNYHMIKAFDNSDPNNVVIQDTSFQVNLGAMTVGSNTQLNIQMDLYEWFSNPNQWDLNQLNTNLMTNFDAQILMNQNGRSVFSLVSVTQ